MPLGSRRVTKLHDLDIDEVSLVDRPANQHGTIAFSKRAEDDMPELYDVETGAPVDVNDLEHGQQVVDENDNVLVWVDDIEAYEQELADDVDSAFEGDYYDDDEDAYDGELAGVGKSAFTEAARLRGRAGAKRASALWSGAKEGIPEDERLSRRARAGLGATRAGARTRNRAGQAAETAGRRGRSAATAAGMQYRALPSGARTGVRYGAPALAGAGGGYEAGHRRVKKSFGESLAVELSKALTDDDRDEVIAKALDYVSEVDERNAELADVVKSLVDEREDEQFGALAGEYHLPVRSDELGRVLKRAAHMLPPDDVDLLDRVLTAAGEQALYAEIGKAGPRAASDVLDEVMGLTEEIVAKSNGLTGEQAMTEVFAVNPDAYDAYLAEHGQLS